MTIELDPMGTACMHQCSYCYLEAQRDAGNFGPKYDLDAMKRAVSEEVGEWKPNGAPFTLHGGDPLGMPIDDLEEILRWAHERWGATALQTTGSPIAEEHLDLFERYGTHVGVSIDGPGEMNDLRRLRGSGDTREATATTERALEEMCERGIRCSVIVVLHRLNVDPDRRSTFKGWVTKLDRMGLTGMRFHPMELDHEAEEHSVAIPELVAFYLDLHEHMAGLKRLRIDLMVDIRRLLEGDDRNVTCTWNACDPYTTPAVRGIDGAGVRTNCGRTNKDGVAHPKAQVSGHERQVALYRTPQSAGGCQGCRWWFACKGQCEGEGLDGDWRSRSSYCELYKALFRQVEQEMLDEGVVPLSLQTRRVEIERLMDAHFQRGNRLSVHAATQTIEGGHVVSYDGTVHGDSPHGDSDHGDGQHGDAPHGDSHGDHTDHG